MDALVKIKHEKTGTTIQKLRKNGWPRNPDVARWVPPIP